MVWVMCRGKAAEADSATVAVAGGTHCLRDPELGYLMIGGGDERYELKRGVLPEVHVTPSFTKATDLVKIDPETRP
jgi:hypothetical protein